MTEKKKFRSDFSVSRRVLLVEIERCCRQCGRRNAVSLTKSETADYTGFECGFCNKFNEDHIISEELPADWSGT